MDRGKAATQYRLRSETRSKRAQKRAATPTFVVLGYPFGFSSLSTPYLRLQAPLRHRPIARDRRGSLLGRRSVNNPG
jgi:hypothetical protein